MDAAMGSDLPQLLEEMLGYLNFSSGAPDPKFLHNFNELFRRIEARVAKVLHARARSADGPAR